MTTIPSQQKHQLGHGHGRQVDRLLTDLPTFSCPFTSSPTVFTPRSPSPTRQVGFPKLAIAHSSYSTDSEILSDNDVKLTSPSLISSLFSRNPSSSCSSSQAAPLTPSGSQKPILRRPDCASASTSASEDGGRRGGQVGWGASSNVSEGVLSRKRSTLTFAVKCSATSDPGTSPLSSFRPCRSFAKSPARLPAWLDDDEEEEEDEEEDCYDSFSNELFDEASDSDDEGYQEDEEGGFTDDEDLAGTFTGLPSWVSTAHWTRLQDKRRTAPVGSEASECPVIRQRGRKISIATTKPDRCSRHVSPPPSRPSSPPPACPPAARSPSAMGLCRRRETRDIITTASSAVETRARGWRSDAPPASILRTTPSSPSSVKTPVLAESSVKLGRRVSAPACSPVSVYRPYLDVPTRTEARRGLLEVFMRRGSAK